MGFKDKVQKTYCTIIGGRFAVEVPTGTTGSNIEVRINKKGREVTEEYHRVLEGKLVGVSTSEHVEYGKSWLFDFSYDDGDIITLKLSYSNGLAVAFLKMLPNIDVSSVVELSPSQKLVEGKNRSSLFINQNKVTIKHAYTRAEPNGMPDLVEMVVSGKKVWDDTDRLIFLEKMVMEDIVPNLTKNVVQSTTGSSDDEFEPDVAGEMGDGGYNAKPNLMDDSGEDIDPEDLPF